MKATRFIRKPFVVSGYQVTNENMDVIATWCRGHVIPADDARKEQAFVRVPVDRPTSQKQTQAFVGTWVILAFNQRGEESFKVYPQEWLNKNFIVLPREIEEDELMARVAIPDIDNDVCCHNRLGTNVRSLPVQGGHNHKTNTTAVDFHSPR